MTAKTSKGSSKKGAPRMSEADLLAFKAKNGAQRVHDPMEGRAALRALNLPAGRFQEGPQKIRQRGVTDPALAALLPSAPVEPAGTVVAPVKAKRRGVEVGPIIASLKHPVREALVGSTDDGPTLSLWFAGARMLTVNDLFSILQSRKHVAWSYKARWKTLIREVLATLDPATPLPHFDGPTRLILFRRGTKEIDLDSFQTVFKYAIDGLRAANVLTEDNPEIMVETVTEQRRGEPAVGLRLERLHRWVAPDKVDLHQAWFGCKEPQAPPAPLVLASSRRSKSS